ncbi:MULTISPECIES: hypothetical protein [unclassified Polynucleobacter]|uniref:hypothetical protein n=1 Tax=unclassified Polynucleobacter TaxID=2640945 RepID=UPI0008B459A0|nr:MULTISPECIES: hypothetical protein [unclassified Polynucleobacter]OHC09587.1 MAG: hypothetical protein A2X74_08640 [Polynucleobacter sp. GWA2_45_21]HBK43276.1 hypothetical protein [Polynucleobacter sp.]
MNAASPNSAPTHTLKEKVKEEFIKAFQLTVYFSIWFCALTLLSVTTLHTQSLSFTLFGFAIIKAALCAKFMLIAQVLYPIKINQRSGIVNSLFLESLFYILVVIALNYLEAGVDGVIHGKDFITSLADFGQSDPLHVLAMSIVYWLIVWPYLIFTGFKLALGSTATHELLLGKKS